MTINAEAIAVAARKALRQQRAATGRALATVFARSARARIDDHLEDAGAQVAIIIADGGDPSGAIAEARKDIQPVLREMADHLAGVFGQRAVA
jgi:hypothetical protein